MLVWYLLSGNSLFDARSIFWLVLIGIEDGVLLDVTPLTSRLGISPFPALINLNDPMLWGLVPENEPPSDVK